MPYLIYAPGNANERVYELRQGVNTLGRQFENSIILLEDTISRHHAYIEVVQNRVIIKDIQSRNHTFVNQVQIDSCQLNDGDIIRFGYSAHCQFVYHLPQSQLEHISNNQKLVNHNLKQIPLSQFQGQLQNLLEQQSRQDSILKLKSGDREQQTLNKFKILLEVSKQLYSPDTLDQLLSKILDLLFQIMEFDRAVILLVDEISQQLEPKATKLKNHLSSEQNFYSRNIVNLSYESGDAIITHNPKQDQRFESSNSIVIVGIENCMCVPLKNYQEIIGVLYVDNFSPLVKYTDEDLEFLSILTNQAAAAIHMSREFYKREQKLKQQVLELQIQIDKTKTENEVAEIMKQDFFQRVQQRAEQIKNKNNLS
ncbi:MAG: GAF domain-containing protein [Nostoc sp.]|uniref:GAF domain-containing protein n=1 Tax=Nostoc sp. TaxID=1180 RepID=UPI002FFADC26